MQPYPALECEDAQENAQPAVQGAFPYSQQEPFVLRMTKKMILTCLGVRMTKEEEQVYLFKIKKCCIGNGITLDDIYIIWM